MSSETDFQTLHAYLTSHRAHVDFGSAASEQSVRAAEAALGLSFPQDYRQYLLTWGTVAVGPAEFYGIARDDAEYASVPNAIWYTKLKRTQVGLPDNLVILQDDNGVKYACLDCSTGKVVVWDVVRREVITRVPQGLFPYILEQATDAIDLIES